MYHTNDVLILAVPLLHLRAMPYLTTFRSESARPGWAQPETLGYATSLRSSAAIVIIIIIMIIRLILIIIIIIITIIMITTILLLLVIIPRLARSRSSPGPSASRGPPSPGPDIFFWLYFFLGLKGEGLRFRL